LVDALLLGRASGIAAWALCTELSQKGLLDEARRAWMGDLLFASARRNPAAMLALEQMTKDYACGHWAGRIVNRWLVDDHASRLGDVCAATLVVQGEVDTPNFRAMAAEYAERMPRARRATLPGVGHMCNLEAPDAFNEAMRRVLA
jgi:pimeloyl-ACP methyl ester carboxylesterase